MLARSSFTEAPSIGLIQVCVTLTDMLKNRYQRVEEVERIAEQDFRISSMIFEKVQGVKREACDPPWPGHSHRPEVREALI